MTVKNSKVGLFPVNFLIQQKIDDAPLLSTSMMNLGLLINAPTETISGVASVFQAVKPP